VALRVGAAFSLVGVLTGFVLVQAATVSARPAGSVVAQGAEALGDTPAKYTGANAVDVIVQDPVAATEDVPEAYAAGCQADQTSAIVHSCEYGDPDGDVTVALVGDSKALQWITAFDEVGAERGWRVVTYTKSACSFTDAVITNDGEPYETCTEWTRAIHERLVADPPDVVVTSQGREKGLNDPNDVSRGESRASMVTGLRDRWTAMTEAGLPVVVMLDNPGPPHALRPVYECVAEHMDDLDVCAFEEMAGSGGREVQLDAAQRVPEVDVVDLVDYVCPGNNCLSVIGNVLVYRQGTHLTKTFVGSLATRLAEALATYVESTRAGQR
jgi:SGNH domain (fused to AT3 domains)